VILSRLEVPYHGEEKPAIVEWKIVREYMEGSHRNSERYRKRQSDPVPALEAVPLPGEDDDCGWGEPGRSLLLQLCNAHSGVT
jgi:hypothetical protein